MLMLSLGFSDLIILHRESHGVLYMNHARGIPFDHAEINELREKVVSGSLKLPPKEGQIAHHPFKQHFLFSLIGKYTITLLLLRDPPPSITRDVLQNFGLRFESRWTQEVQEIYTTLQGNLEVFHKDTPTRPNLDTLVSEIFHLELVDPFQLGPAGNGAVLSGVQKKVWNMAEEMARENPRFYLRDLYYGCAECFSPSQNRSAIAKAIYDLTVQNFFLSTIGNLPR
jgi:hypothetical protein